MPSPVTIRNANSRENTQCHLQWQMLPNHNLFPAFIIHWGQHSRVFPSFWILLAQFKFQARQQYASLVTVWRPLPHCFASSPPPLPRRLLLTFALLWGTHHILALHTVRLTRTVYIFVRGSAESLTSFLTIGIAGSKVRPAAPSGCPLTYSI